MGGQRHGSQGPTQRPAWPSPSHHRDHHLPKPPGAGGGMAQGLGIQLCAFGGAYRPLATAHSDPLWARTCFGCVNGAPGCLVLFDYSGGSAVPETGLLPVPLTRCIQMHTPSPCGGGSHTRARPGPPSGHTRCPQDEPGRGPHKRGGGAPRTDACGRCRRGRWCGTDGRRGPCGTAGAPAYAPRGPASTNCPWRRA